VPHQKAANEINRQHRLAKETASQAVDHALAVGELLAQVKGELPHGSFEAWVEANCDFAPRTARAYMKVAQNGNALPNYPSLRQALGWSDAPKAAKTDTPKGAVSVVKAAAPAATEETGDDRPAAPATPPAAEAAIASDAAGVPAGGEDDIPAEYVLTADEVADLDAAAAREEAESVQRVMSADDRLAAAHAEIKRQAAEIAALKISRDGFMGGKAEVMNLLQREQRKTAALQRKLDAANAEVERLRERVAVMEAA
jgi:hypothetical protein